MQFDIDPLEKEFVYQSQLKEVSGRSFTNREIDVLSCLLGNRKDKKIASLLSLSPKTVGAHIYNVMKKLGYNSREQIIDFAEKSGKLPYFSKYYLCVLIEDLFLKQLKKIAAVPDRNYNKFNLIYNDGCEEVKLLGKLLNYLQLAKIDINISKEINKDFKQLIICCKTDELNIASTVKDQIIISFCAAPTDRINDLTYLDFSNKLRFYQSTLKLLEILTQSNSIKSVIMEFSKDSHGISESFQKGVRIHPEALLTNSITVLNKSKFFIFIFFVIILSITWMIFFHNPYKKGDIQPTIQEINQNFAQFVQILSSDNISDDLQRRKNHKILGKVENTVKYFDDENVRQYFLKIDLPLEELLNSLYVLHALANQYTYDSHNGANARKLLTYAKNFAEQYVKNNYLIKKDFAKYSEQRTYNNAQLKEKEFNFDNLTEKEILLEFQGIKDLPELYTRIVYLLGRTYTYQGDINQSYKYFKLANYLGTELHLFEGFLSIRSGTEFITEKEIVSALLRNDTKAAKIKILDSIKVNKALLEDEKEYIVNYKPTSQSHSTIIPKNDLFNQFYCKEVLSKHYARLITHSNNSKKQAKYLKEIQSIYLGEDKNSGLLNVVDKLTTKRISSSYNNLANILLKLYEKDIWYNEFNDILSKRFQINSTKKLEVIKTIFDIARTIAPPNYYTQADSYDGIVRVNRTMLQQDNIDPLKRKHLEEEIKEYVILRDKINKILKREGWRLNKHLI